MSTHEPVRQPNEEPAPQTTAEGAGSPQPPAERFCGIANSRVEVMANSLDEVVRRLDELGADRQDVEIWEADPDSGKVAYSWSCRRIPPERAGYLSEKSLYRSNPVLARNAELARRINEEAWANPQSPYAGKIVGITNGQVIVVADNRDEVIRRLDEVSAGPLDRYIVEASSDPNKVEYIW
jgi:hypothetical protein